MSSSEREFENYDSMSDRENTDEEESEGSDLDDRPRRQVRVVVLDEDEDSDEGEESQHLHRLYYVRFKTSESYGYIFDNSEPDKREYRDMTSCSHTYRSRTLRKTTAGQLTKYLSRIDCKIYYLAFFSVDKKSPWYHLDTEEIRYSELGSIYESDYDRVNKSIMTHNDLRRIIRSLESNVSVESIYIDLRSDHTEPDDISSGVGDVQTLIIQAVIKMLSLNKGIRSLGMNYIPKVYCHIFDFLQYNSTLKRLNIGANCLSEEDSKSLIKALSSNLCSITELYLSGCEFSDDTLIDLMRMLRTNTTIVKLSLPRQLYISANIVHHLMTNLVYNSTLQCLNLDTSVNCEIIDKPLCILPKDTGLRKLNMKNTRMQDDDMEALCLQLRTNKSITSLDISYNNFTGRSIHHLIEILKRKNLYKLDISETRILDVNSVKEDEELAHVIRTHTSLQILRVRDTCMSRATMIKVLDAVKDNTSIHTLEIGQVDFRYTRSSSDIVNSFGTARHTRVTRLDVRDFYKDMHYALTQMLLNNSLLRVLILKQTNNDHTGNLQYSILEALKTNKSLKEIKIIGIVNDNKILDMISRSLQTNDTILGFTFHSEYECRYIRAIKFLTSINQIISKLNNSVEIIPDLTKWKALLPRKGKCPIIPRHIPTMFCCENSIYRKVVNVRNDRDKEKDYIIEEALRRRGQSYYSIGSYRCCETSYRENIITCSKRNLLQTGLASCCDHGLFRTSISICPDQLGKNTTYQHCTLYCSGIHYEMPVIDRILNILLCLHLCFKHVIQIPIEIINIILKDYLYDIKDSTIFDISPENPMCSRVKRTIKY